MFEKELKRLGLKDKEASVYIACLELGPSPVQTIARKSKVVRATTYVILEALMNMGLATKYKEGKKTLFTAEPPRQLMRLLEKERENIDEKQHDLELLLPELHVLMKTSGGRPSVRYFRGKEGLHVIRQEIVLYCQSGDTIYNFTPADYVEAVFPANQGFYHSQRVAKGIKARTILATKSTELRRVLRKKSKSDINIRLFVPSDQFGGSSGFTVFRDRIAIGDFSGKNMGGVIIESESMAGTMRNLFELAWKEAERIDEK